MADAGVGEAAAVSSAKGAETAGAAKGAETAGSALGADVLSPIAAAEGSTLIPEISVTGDALGAGGLGADAAATAGAGAATGGAVGLSPDLFGGRFAGAVDPSSVIGSDFNNLLPPSLAADASPLPVFNLDGTPEFTSEQNATVAGINQQMGLPPPGTPAAPSGAGASSFAPPSGTSTAGLDPTSSIASNPQGQSLDQLAVDRAVPQASPTNLAPPDASATPPGTTPAASSSSFGSSLVKGATDSITKNPLGIALAGGGLLYNMLQGNKTPANQNNLQSQADQLAAQGSQLASYLQNGTLPPGIKTAVDQATQAAKARVISNYASRGAPTDPSKNSALAQELNAIDEASVISTSQIGQQLMQTGISETQLSSNIYESLLKIDQTQQAQTGQAIANFAAALGGGARATIGGKQVTVT